MKEGSRALIISAFLLNYTPKNKRYFRLQNGVCGSVEAQLFWRCTKKIFLHFVTQGNRNEGGNME